MKSGRSSTIPRYRKVLTISGSQHEIFNQLVTLLKPYSTRLDTRLSTPEHYELWTKHNFRSTSMNPKDKRGILFAGALIMKRHVGLYLFPLHMNPELGLHMDEILKPFWKGNSAFHFNTQLSELILSRLSRLLDEGWEYYRVNQWIF